MNKNKALAAKMFMKMANYDRKFIVFSSVVSTILTVSMIIKLIISAVCTLSLFKNN